MDNYWLKLYNTNVFFKLSIQVAAYYTNFQYVSVHTESLHAILLRCISDAF